MGRMTKREGKKDRILLKRRVLLTREDIFRAKSRFHREQAKLPFEEKIKILVKLQEIAKNIRGKDVVVWEISD